MQNLNFLFSELTNQEQFNFNGVTTPPTINSRNEESELQIISSYDENNRNPGSTISG